MSLARVRPSRGCMTSPPAEPSWQPLLEVALAALATLDRDVRWSWGGGTALALRLEHRISLDIDIFLPDATALRSLSPQRNPAVRALTDRWQEPGHYLKLEFAQGEVDFIAAPADRSRLPGLALPGSRPAPGDRGRGAGQEAALAWLARPGA